MGGGVAGGALGIGAKLCTDAVIVIDKDNLLMAPIGSPGSFSQVIDKIPQIISSMSPGSQGAGGGAQGGQNAAQGTQSGSQNNPMGSSF
jgi:uncharacterized spore protein YtfJ